MSRHMTDDERRAFIKSHYNLIESAIEAARSHMTDEPDCHPGMVDLMFKHIECLAKFGQELKWPDPAKLVQEARQDPALQKLLKQASKKTLIRAR